MTYTIIFYGDTVVGIEIISFAMDKSGERQTKAQQQEQWALCVHIFQPERRKIPVDMNWLQFFRVWIIRQKKNVF